MKSRIFLFLLAIGLQAFSQKKQPNIILIMADDIGFEAFGSYGNTNYKTPRIDKMAANGMQFNYCYSQPLCTPSRVQIMTGKYNFRNYLEFGSLDMNETTFAHVLKSEGYKTCIAGKWQLGSDAFGPYKAGFDQYHLWQLTFTSYNERYKNPRVLENGVMKKYTNGEYGPKLHTEFIKNFMEENKDQPFFAYYPMALTHRPYVPSPDTENYDSYFIPGEGNAHSTKSDPIYFKDEVAYMDKLVGEIIDKTVELGIADNTLIIFTGDNGTGVGIKSKMGDVTIPGMKGSTTEYGMHVPLVAYWAGQIKGGQKSNYLVDFTDFLPTIAQAANIKLPETFETDGLSFYPQLMGDFSHTRDWIFSHYDPGKEKFSLKRLVQNQEWKLYETGEFYNVKKDPFEKKDLAKTQLSPTTLKLKDEFAAVLAKMHVVEKPKSKNTED
ncbi:arylsulfatase [Lacihabitans sp. LS3-19]|uniref:sulfatase-like hydrolase/transferase n=1 Tax=Lacihabitans sp. LS3-19 TaxID=2487335 RepID=UPI0020CF460E|nr:sulfatase-like hydrolase/transferase [Lacihabitans sp. LS3-19]MCP9767847.1 arylsulfatase [Lacihabitans sp. LS3-19]